MIKILRFSFILLTGTLTIISLTGSGNIVLPLLFIVPLILWLFLSQRFTVMHNLILPVYTGAAVSGLIFGNGTIFQLLLMLMILTAWDLDSLYIDSKGKIRKGDEWKMIKPLLLREVFTLIPVFLSMGISAVFTFSLGFWPLVFLVLLLIFTMRKIYRSNR